MHRFLVVAVVDVVVVMQKGKVSASGLRSGSDFDIWSALWRFYQNCPYKEKKIKICLNKLKVSLLDCCSVFFCILPHSLEYFSFLDRLSHYCS